MARIGIFLAFAGVLLAALALISCLSIEDEERIRGLPRFLWVIVIIMAPLIGSVAWFFAGRPVQAGRPRGWRIGPAAGPSHPRPPAPDDDPDFLRSINDSTVSREDEELLRRWEEDLRRREDELRQRDQDNDG